MKERVQFHFVECAWFPHNVENWKCLTDKETSPNSYSRIILDNLCVSRKGHMARSDSVRLLGISLLVDALQIMELMGGSESNLRARNVSSPPN